MARQFNGSTQYLDRSSAVVSAVPLTMSCWAYFDAAVNHTMLGITAAGSQQIFILDAPFSGLGFNSIRVYADNGGAADSAVSAGTVSLSTWAHCVAVFASSTSRTVYLNGSATAGGGTNVAMGAVDRTTAGKLFFNGGSSNFMQGRIAEAGVWSVALTADEITSLSKGVSPLLVRPQSLVSHWPLMGRASPEIDPRGALDLTVTGATQAEHPPVYYPRNRSTVFVPAAGGAAAAPFGFDTSYPHALPHHRTKLIAY